MNWNLIWTIICCIPGIVLGLWTILVPVCAVIHVAIHPICKPAADSGKKLGTLLIALILGTLLLSLGGLLVDTLAALGLVPRSWGLNGSATL
jgi:hypothetical protein